MDITSFHPPRRILLGPGPSEVHPRVLGAMARNTIGHLDPDFLRLMDQLQALLAYAFRTNTPVVFAISGPGSAGMEFCFVNLVEPEDAVIVCSNGVFGERMIQIVERCGGRAIPVRDAWGSPVDPEKLRDALRQHPEAKIVAFVHAETSTGVRSDAETIARIAREHGCLTIMDAVTSLGGIPVEIDAWQIDSAYSGSQKCLSAPPGLSPVTMSARAVEVVRKRKTKVQSWFLDLNLLLGYWQSDTKRAYHHTAPVNALYGLHEALLMLQEEGLENAWKRHEQNHLALRAGVEAMGLVYAVEKQYRLPQLNSLKVPNSINEADVRSTLLKNFNLEIGGGLGELAGRIWRVGLMGQSSNPGNVLFCLAALETVLQHAGVPIHTSVAQTAARASYDI